MAAVSKNRKRDQPEVTEPNSEQIPPASVIPRANREAVGGDEFSEAVYDPYGRIIYVQEKKPRPSKRTPESVARGRKLQEWLDANDHDMATFARDAGLSKMAVSHYVHGDVDIASMHQRTVEKILGAMGVSDTWAWSYFDIPESRRTYWRTFRPRPLGHGEEKTQQVMTIILDGPMSGEQFSAPAGAVVTLDQSNRLLGLQLVRMQNRFVLAYHDALPAQGQVLGEFLSVAPGGAG